MSQEDILPVEVEENESDRFESQFSNREKFIAAGAEAESIDVSPESLKTEVPVLIAPGWGATMEVFKPAMKTMTESDRRVLSLDHPRRGGEISREPNEELGEYHLEELRKAYNILDLLEYKGIEKTDVVAHSEGAINVTLAAMLHPDKFRNIIFYGPAGLIGPDTFTRLVKGALANGERPESLSHIPMTKTEEAVRELAGKETLKYLSQNPVRGAKEIAAIKESQIHDALRYLHEKGIGIVVMAGVDDTMFPMDKMQEVVKADMLDGFLSLRGGHMEIQTRPEEYMNAAEQMITALEEKAKKKVLAEDE